MLSETEMLAPYLVEAGRAETSAAVVGTVMLIVLLLVALAVNVPALVPFFWIVRVALPTVGWVAERTPFASIERFEPTLTPPSVLADAVGIEVKYPASLLKALTFDGMAAEVIYPASLVQ